jgi:hypothetical protein
LRPVKISTFMLVSAALAIGFAGSGCTGNPATTVPVWAGGEPQGLPPPPAEPGQFPNVYDMPPARPTKPISEAEQKRLEADLTALRKRVNPAGDAAEKTSGAKPR